MENAPLSAQEITGELMEDSAAHEAAQAQELEAAIREGIGMLFEDGWTGEELSALSQDAMAGSAASNAMRIKETNFFMKSSPYVFALM